MMAKLPQGHNGNMTYKALARIPDKTPYAYLEVELSGEANDIIRQYFELKDKFEARYNEELKTKVKKGEW